MSVHPFPARMAPEIALAKLRELRRGSVVLDPMVGSGTVMHEAAKLGLQGIGLDLDPLAVLISRVSVGDIAPSAFWMAADKVYWEVRTLRDGDVYLPWIDGDDETERFVKYWFGRPQCRQLRKLAYSINLGVGASASRPIRDALKVALSRLIVTKQRGASLAWDVSHSRPHKVISENDFDVVNEFVHACEVVAHRSSRQSKFLFAPRIGRGDARLLRGIDERSVDAIVTSPPYLNAIDYMRGHRMALIWLGYSTKYLREIRGISIGSERQAVEYARDHRMILSAFGMRDSGSPRMVGMLKRYADDMSRFFAECRRVLRASGSLYIVVAESRFRGSRIRTGDALAIIGYFAGFKLANRERRTIPTRSRYLPVTGSDLLAKRMMSELVLTFRPI